MKFNVILLTLLLISPCYAGKYSGGDGSLTLPYLISTSNHVQEISENPDDWDKHFKMTADIDLAGITWVYSPVSLFTGSFDGGGYVIKNLKIEGEDQLGFFGRIDTGGVVNNLGLENISITGQNSLGGICGLAYGEVVISNCYSSGTITGKKYLGGLCGVNNKGRLVDSHSGVSLVGSDDSECVGGVCGQAIEATIINCYAIGNITGKDRIGGLCGYGSGQIVKCYSNGSVSGGAESVYIGGLCGFSIGTISKSYSAGNVNGGYRVGGLCGINYGFIHKSYSSGSVKGKSYVGGLCGWGRGIVSDSYSTGSVDADEFSGGMLGADDGGVYLACFWDATINPGLADIGYSLSSRIPSVDSPGIFAETTENMQKQSTYTGWDFAGESINGTNEIWQMPAGGYPVLCEMSGYKPVQLTGDGTKANPYLISNANQLGAIYHYPINAHYLMTEDIDFSGITWSVSPVDFLDGSFDGNGHTISNLTIVDTGVENENLGLFAKIGTGGQVKGLKLVNLVISGDESVGGICGTNDGSIIDCLSSGSITGDRQVAGICANNNGSITNSLASGTITANSSAGGICSVNTSTGLINGCNTTADVNGQSSIGGFCASNAGTILNCSSSGNVIGNSDIGGFCGNMTGKTSNCFSNGNVIGKEYVGGFSGRDYQSDVSNCFSGSSVTCCDSSRYVGGFLGLIHYGNVTYCYSTGTVIAGDDSESIGGFCGLNSSGKLNHCYSVSEIICQNNTERLGGLSGNNSGGVFVKCFWDTGINPTLADIGYDSVTKTYDVDSPDIIAETSENMQIQSTFAGWDFVGKITDGTHEIWQMPAEGSPVLSGMNGYEPLELSGEGIETNPYLIGNADELGAMYYYPVNAHYLMTDDIDLSGITWGVSPIPFFDGVFDGGGHVISKLTIEGGSNLGLFKIIDGGKVKNLGLTDVSITGKISIGAFCGQISNGYIINSYSTGTVSGEGYIGGLCGSNGNGNISGCYSNIIITAKDGSEYVGGLCANNRGTISNCYSNGSIDGSDGTRYVGGLCGHSRYGQIINCYSTVNVTSGDNTYANGGLCGFNERGSITNSYSIGNVKCGSSAVTIAGFCGQNYSGTIVDCYSFGSVEFGDSPRYYGPFCGRVNGTGVFTTGCFWNIDANPELNGPEITGAQGLTAQQMQTVSSFTNAGWDFAGNNANGTNEIWQMSAEGYPVLCELSEYEPVQLSGDGTEENPYLIGNANELGAIYHYPGNAFYLMNNDIDLSGITWRVSPIASFDGKFDGGGHVISNLSIEDKIRDNEHLGLFGRIGSNGSVKDLGVTIASVGTYGYFGVLCGINQGRITDCYSTGNLASQHYADNIGGLCSINGASGRIEGSYSTVGIIGGHSSSNLGGLCGFNKGLISYCYSKGEIYAESSDYAGGLCGRNEGNISYCYSSGNLTANSYLGGLCGSNSGHIINCSSTGNLIAKYSNPRNIGGLCGQSYNGGTISNCYSSGDITSERHSPRAFGGLCGYVNKGSVINSYSTCDLFSPYSSEYFGGLCGDIAESSISNCYSKGIVSVSSYSKYIGGLCGRSGRTKITKSYSASQVIFGDNSMYVGGICGYNQYSGFTACFWDISINPIIADCGYDYLTRTDNVDLENVYAKTTLEMQTKSTFSEAGWDFDTPVWVIEESVAYPQFLWEMLIDLRQLREDIEAMTLKKVFRDKLLKHIDNALEKLEDNNLHNNNSAVGSLIAFVNFVKAKNGKIILQEDGDKLITEGQHFIAMISKSPGKQSNHTNRQYKNALRLDSKRSGRSIKKPAFRPQMLKKKLRAPRTRRL